LVAGVSSKNGCGLLNLIGGIGDELVRQIAIGILSKGQIDGVNRAQFDCSLFKDRTSSSKQKT
jgi:hypothetical protein